MFDKSGTLRYKKEARVTVALASQEPFDASVFLKVDERLIDLLNDARGFIPVKRADGSTIILAKSNIVSIIERSSDDPDVQPDEPDTGDARASAPDPEEEARAAEAREKARGQRSRFKRTYDPYEILRVSPDATIEEIRKAYKARMKAVHPDSIAALDLDDDFERAAILAAQKVNHAYQKILKDRKETAKGAKPSADSDAA
jgi:hypothetical protein